MVTNLTRPTQCADMAKGFVQKTLQTMVLFRRTMPLFPSFKALYLTLASHFTIRVSSPQIISRAYIKEHQASLSAHHQPISAYSWIHL